MDARKMYTSVLSTVAVFVNKWVSIHNVTIREGVEPYLMFVVPDYVSVLPWRMTPNGVVVLLLRVFRQAAGTVWEPCEGVIEPGEEDHQSILRELKEEAGVSYVDSQWQEPIFIGNGYKATDRAIRAEPMPGFELSATVLRLYLIELNPQTVLGEQTLDPEEEITPNWVPLSEAVAMVKRESRRYGANLALLFLLKELQEYVRTIPAG